MCGIIGFVNRGIPKLNINNFTSQALIVNSLRGTDGSGLLLVEENGDISMYKRPLPGWDLTQLATTRNIISSSTPVFGLIHNRAGTNGGNKVETSHPVIHEHIHLIHNGVVTQLTSIGASWDEHDSTAIAKALASKTEKEVLELLTGSYALIWYNSKDKTFNVARNEERPLYIATAKKNKSAFFSSEDGALLWLAERNQIELKDITEFKTGMHLKVPLDGKEKSRSAPFKIKKYEPPTNYGYQGRWTDYTKYSLVNKGEEFYARYEGRLIYANESTEYLKFKHVNDSVYGWVVVATEEYIKKLDIGELYKLRALDSRVNQTNSSNLDAAIVSLEKFNPPAIPTVKDNYVVGSTIKFLPLQAIAKPRGWTVSGITDDTQYTNVRGFCITHLREIDLDELYEATIQTIATSNKAKQEYILIDGSTMRPCREDSLTHCGWCDDPLSVKEALENQVPELGNSAALCNSCHSHYMKSGAI